MVKTLCLDFGNTRLKAAIFNGEELEEKLVLNGDGLDDLSLVLKKYKPEFSILSSVIDQYTNHDCFDPLCLLQYIPKEGFILHLLPAQFYCVSAGVYAGQDGRVQFHW